MATAKWRSVAHAPVEMVAWKPVADGWPPGWWKTPPPLTDEDSWRGWAPLTPPTAPGLRSSQAAASSAGASAPQAAASSTDASASRGAQVAGCVSPFSPRRLPPSNAFALRFQIAIRHALQAKIEVLHARLKVLVAWPMLHGKAGRTICRKMRETTYCLEALVTIQNSRIENINRYLEGYDAQPPEVCNGDDPDDEGGQRGGLRRRIVGVPGAITGEGGAMVAPTLGRYTAAKSAVRFWPPKEKRKYAEEARLRKSQDDTADGTAPPAGGGDMQ